MHFNQKYGTFANASAQPDGLLVLGVGLWLSSSYYALQPIVNSIPQIIEVNTTAVINGLYLDELLPLNTLEFFKYDGSLTTPPCYQSVTWVVFPETIPISANQVSGHTVIPIGCA